MKIKFSKKQWQSVGKKTGWMKETQEIDFSQVGKRYSASLLDNWQALLRIVPVGTALHNLKSPLRMLINNAMGSVVEDDPEIKQMIERIVFNISEIEERVGETDDLLNSFFIKNGQEINQLAEKMTTMRDKPKELKLREQSKTVGLNI